MFIPANIKYPEKKFELTSRETVPLESLSKILNAPSTKKFCGKQDENHSSAPQVGKSVVVVHNHTFTKITFNLTETKFKMKMKLTFFDGTIFLNSLRVNSFCP